MPKEPFSSLSHLFGAVLAIPGLVWLVVGSDGDPWRTVGFSIYGASLIVLYGASTLYHWLPVSPRAEAALQRFDHIAIYLLIAGTYTPVCLVTLRGAWGWSLLGTIWGLALAGSALKLFAGNHARWLGTTLYVAMGWIAVVAAVPLVRAVPFEGLWWLVAGGALYTAGALIYALQRPDPLPNVFGFHDIFHLFVLGGSAAHFVFMVRFV